MNRDNARPRGLPVPRLAAAAHPARTPTATWKLRADPSPLFAEAPARACECLAEKRRGIQIPAADIEFESLVAPSVEDAITAVALNVEIQAGIIRQDLPLRSRDWVPLMNTLLGANEDVGVSDR